MADTTVVLDSGSSTGLSSISSDQQTLVFSATAPSTPSLNSGDVIAMGISAQAPDGLLRKVTDVSASGDSVVVSTVQATLAEALESADLSISGTLNPDDVEDTVSTLNGVSVARAKQGELAGVLSVNASDYLFKTELKDVVLYDADGNNSTTDDQVLANGRFYFNVSYDFELQVEYLQVQRLRFTVTPKEYSELTISTNIPTGTLKRRKTLTTLRMKPFTVAVNGFPIVVRPIVDLNIGLDGELDVGITTGASQSASLTGGLLYSDGAWSELREQQTAFDYQAPQVNAAASLLAYTGPTLTLQLYGFIGPYSNAEGYLSFTADLAADPWWSLYAGARMGVGIDVTVLGTNLLSYEVPDLLKQEVLLAQGEPMPPTLQSAVGADGKVELSWESAIGATHYNLYWSSEPGFSLDTANRIEGVVSPYSHTGLTNGEDYYYVLTSANILSESAPSNEEMATPVECMDLSGVHNVTFHYSASQCSEAYLDTIIPSAYPFAIEQQGCRITSVNGVATDLAVPLKQYDPYGDVVQTTFYIRLPWETTTYPYTSDDSFSYSHSGEMVLELAPLISLSYNHPATGSETFSIAEDNEAGEWDLYTEKSVNVYALYPDGNQDWFPYCYDTVFYNN